MSKRILDEIITSKKKRLKLQKEKISLKEIMAQCIKFSEKSSSFVNAISVDNQVSIIAEMKKKSPSAGVLLKNYSPQKFAKIYEQAGAQAISVLTEEDYFAGRPEDILQVKRITRLPILRKDFIFDSYQIYESKILGANAVLLILAILTKESYAKLLQLTKELGMTALVEVHTEKELEMALTQKPDMIGINNRNLKTLKVNIETSFKLAEKVPKGIPVVAESGIKNPETIHELKSAGISAALIGESLLKSKNLLTTLKSFVTAGKRNA